MTEQDKFVEKVVLRNEFATEKQLQKAKKILEANPGKSLIQVIVHVKFISKEQAKSILKLYEKKRLKKKSVNQPQESSPINAGPAFLDDFHGGGAPTHTPAPTPTPAPAPSPAPQPQISVSHSGGSFSSLEEYLLHARGKNASDIHLNTDCKPLMRLHGSLIELGGSIFSAEKAHQLLFSALTPEQQQQIQEKKGLDFSYIDQQGNRYRACIVKQRTGWNGAFRIIRRTPPTCEELGLPENLKRLVEYHQGLVLVTGPKGSGKTTTLASLVDLINQQREDHIITIEDPVEYVFSPKTSHINQRQVGKHTASFSAALRAALREDPDVIMIGELRDLETTSLAISASETGHLVFGTLHTTSAGRTIEQIIDVFPPDQQSQVRTMISESIKGIICQQLIPRKDGSGRALALEIMFNTNAVANLIRERKLFQLGSVMQMGKKQGMVTLDHSLYQLVKDGVIDGQVAYYAAVDKSRFQEWAPKKDF
ncbi:type IV pilus twitching motility protein PilT [Candidatus Uabimicrobium amorphum]|uniref:Twitching motility protein PilT n=1 Tax=Uabimicrobium amorphum TaxID=2596890 RepID=A0A5S9IT76_UABAM|nr:PilT/PilU family type 4a pilus ATPase [Candidatus Uabimicrobium amorphum]BBM87659.1 twitching motility protein PilT [Candidatus Uabimicrobium amorphum]